uniref:Uncharacterized protein n=1 Tax=Maylandia zebra TaxID=106582 RepID=A0A3P9BFK8_9CICH
MAGYTGLRSCTWTEFPAHVFNSSSLLTQGSAASSCDLTLLTCLLIGSYRFCIIPLLAIIFFLSLLYKHVYITCW